MNDKIIILHNPKCGKSRNGCKWLEENNENYETLLYLKQDLSLDFIRDLIKKLNIKPIELVRINEKIWKENYKNKTLTDDEIIKIIHENPILIERPIVIKGEKAVIGRPIENIINFLK